MVTGVRRKCKFGMLMQGRQPLRFLQESANFLLEVLRRKIDMNGNNLEGVSVSDLAECGG